MRFTKYHALGNDYIVIDPKLVEKPLSEKAIKTLCARHYGVGSDGILYGPERSDTCDFSLKIYNPDASEAEKSGNGLRIFSRYLWDRKLVSNQPFSIQTKGGIVYSHVASDGLSVSVSMGKVRFTHDATGEPPATANTLNIGDHEFIYYLANVGNPHCVIFVDDINQELAQTFGPAIEQDARFTNRTNVQFVKILDRSSIQIEIWERGAGYTLASGSSSAAAASVSHVLGYCDAKINVLMPGGIINIELDQQFYATMTGAVRKICDGVIDDEMLQG